jgi:hypothetical protein
MEEDEKLAQLETKYIQAKYIASIIEEKQKELVRYIKRQTKELENYIINDAGEELIKYQRLKNKKEVKNENRILG